MRTFLNKIRVKYGVDNVDGLIFILENMFGNIYANLPVRFVFLSSVCTIHLLMFLSQHLLIFNDTLYKITGWTRNHSVTKNFCHKSRHQVPSETE